METTRFEPMDDEVRDVFADAEREGIDLSLLHENLRLTPTERLEHHQRFLRFVLDVREAGAVLRRR